MNIKIRIVWGMILFIRNNISKDFENTWIGILIIFINGL